MKRKTKKKKRNEREKSFTTSENHTSRKKNSLTNQHEGTLRVLCSCTLFSRTAVPPRLPHHFLILWRPLPSPCSHVLCYGLFLPNPHFLRALAEEGGRGRKGGYRGERVEGGEKEGGGGGKGER